MGFRRPFVVFACVLSASAVVFAAHAATRDDGVEPKNGGMYPPGTVVRGSCTVTPGETTYTGVVSYLLVLDYFGLWMQNAEQFDVDTGCKVRVTAPGKYRIETYHITQDGLGEPSDVDFEIRDKDVNDCKGSRNAITSVWTPSGKTYGLGGEQLQTGRTYDFPEDVELTLGDGSIVRMKAQSQVRMSNCGTSENRPVTMKIILGKVWATVTKHLGGGEMELQTERAVCGNRGTKWWMAYDPERQLTTVHVDSGRVWIRNKFGKPKTLELHAGQTATQQGNGQPRLR